MYAVHYGTAGQSPQNTRVTVAQMGPRVGSFRYFSLYAIHGTSPNQALAVQVQRAGSSDYWRAGFLYPQTFTWNGRAYTVPHPNQGPNRVGARLGSVNELGVYEVQGMSPVQEIALQIGEIYILAVAGGGQ